MSSKDPKDMHDLPGEDTLMDNIANDQESFENTDSEQVAVDENASQVVQEKQELQNKYLRLLAEFDNYKKRTARQQNQLLETAAKDTLTALLPVLDDFDRARAASDDGFSEGVDLVHKKLISVLKQRGLEAMVSNGEVFDAELHEAITEIPAPSEELKGTVIDTVERGYTLNGNIIRHAKVVVGK